MIQPLPKLFGQVQIAVVLLKDTPIKLQDNIFLLIAIVARYVKVKVALFRNDLVWIDFSMGPMNKFQLK